MTEIQKFNQKLNYRKPVNENLKCRNNGFGKYCLYDEKNITILCAQEITGQPQSTSFSKFDSNSKYRRFVKQAIIRNTRYWGQKRRMERKQIDGVIYDLYKQLKHVQGIDPSHNNQFQYTNSFSKKISNFGNMQTQEEIEDLNQQVYIKKDCPEIIDFKKFIIKKILILPTCVRKFFQDDYEKLSLNMVVGEDESEVYLYEIQS